MIFLLEAIWCMIEILIKICWLPALIFGALAIIARCVGESKRAADKEKKAKAKKAEEDKEEEA